MAKASSALCHLGPSALEHLLDGDQASAEADLQLLLKTELLQLVTATQRLSVMANRIARDN